MSAPGEQLVLSSRLLKRCGFVAAVSGVVCIGYLLSRTNPSGEWQKFFPKCMFFAATGLHCPGCGCQRGLHHLFNGRLRLALQCNAMVMIALPWLIWEAVRASLIFLEFPVPRFMMRRVRLSGRQAMSIAVAVTLFWILRNVPCPPFELLAPPQSMLE